MKTRSFLFLLLMISYSSTITAQENSKYKLFGMAMSVSNLDTTIKWYGDILGFKVLQRSEFPVIHAKTAFIEGDGIRLELLQVENPIRVGELFADPPNHMKPIGNKALILYVDDLPAVTRSLEKKKVVFAFKEIILNDKGLKSTIIRDPDGNFISIFGKQGMIKIQER